MSKRGKKCKLDCQNWSSCSNFCQMNDKIASEMADSGIASILDEPDHMDSHRNHVSSKHHAFGLSTTHDIIHPSYAIIAN